jgi:hypothetical protein
MRPKGREKGPPLRSSQTEHKTRRVGGKGKGLAAPLSSRPTQKERRKLPSLSAQQLLLYLGLKRFRRNTSHPSINQLISSCLILNTSIYNIIVSLMNHN